MHILNAEAISKNYGESPLFTDVNFGITSGDRIALIGSNGSGKSTLASIIAGATEPDTGTVTVARGMRIHYLPQNPVFAPDTTVLQEVFRGEDPALKALFTYYGLARQLEREPHNDQLIQEMAQINIRLERLGAWELESSGRAILTRLGVPAPQTPTASLSGGERKRIALARALITPCELLILDEPTNHLDIQAILWLEDYLQKRAGALLLITHDRWLLSRVANRILEVDRGEFLDCAGGYQKYLELKAERAQAEQAAARKHRAALKRELTWMLQGAQGRSTKERARKKMFRELNRQTFRAEKAQVELDIPAARLGKKVIELEGIAKGYGDRVLIRDLSYTLLPRDRIGIVGPNGSGKTTLLDIFAGLTQPDRGTVQRGETVRIGYYRQLSQELNDSLRVIQYIEGIRLSVKTASGETISAAKMLERFLFQGSQQWTYIRDLSGGERRRLYLLGILMEEPNVLLLDEPTNDLDIETLTVLEDYLEDFPGAVLAVSHDRWFLDKTMDHLFCLDGRGDVRLFTGSFSQYLAQGSQGDGEAAPEKRDARGKREKTKLSYKEQREYEELEAAIDALQQELDQLQQEQAQAGADYVLLHQLHEQAQELEQELEAKMERWLELQDLKEEYEKA
jgi:ATP-binding cassette subfamily F protein uup